MINKVEVGPWTFEQMPDGNMRVQRTSWIAAPVKQVFIPAEVLLAVAAEILRARQIEALQHKPADEILEIGPRSIGRMSVRVT